MCTQLKCVAKWETLVASVSKKSEFVDQLAAVGAAATSKPFWSSAESVADAPDAGLKRGSSVR